MVGVSESMPFVKLRKGDFRTEAPEASVKCNRVSPRNVNNDLKQTTV